MNQSVTGVRIGPLAAKRIGLAGLTAVLFPVCFAVAGLHENLSIALALAWMLFVPFGVGLLALEFPSSRVRSFALVIKNAGRYGVLIKWSIGFLVALPVSMLATALSGSSTLAAIGLLIAALAGFLVGRGAGSASSSLTIEKRIVVLLIVPLSIGLLYAGYIRSFSPFPLTPGMDVFTHLYVVKGIANNSLDSPLLYAPAFDTLIAMGSSATNADLTGVFWAGSFVIAPIFAASTFALTYRFTRNFATALVSTVIALSVTEQGFIPNMQSFYPSSFVMALFPLVICAVDKVWRAKKTAPAHKLVATAAILAAITVLHFQLGILVSVISAIFIAGANHLNGRRAIMLYGIRAATIAITALLLMYYFSLFDSQLAVRIADGQYSYGVPMKVKLLNDWYTDKIILMFFAGLVLMSLFKDNRIALLGFIGSVIMLLYFQKIDIIHRFLALERPLIALGASVILTWPASVVFSYLDGFRRAKKKIPLVARIKLDTVQRLFVLEQKKVAASIAYSVLVIMVLFPTLMQPFDVYESAYAKHDSSFANFTTEELAAANWIEHNTPPRYTLFSDPFTVIEMRGLAYRKNIEAISWNNTVAGIVKSSLTADNSTSAYSTIVSQFGTDNIVVISPRTSQWVRGTDYFVQFADKDFTQFRGFHNFFDDKYFNLVYHSDNIYVFLTKSEPGRT